MRLTALLLLLIGTEAAAQLPQVQDVPKPLPIAGPVITPTSDTVEKLRNAQLHGTAPVQGLIFRSTSSLTSPGLTSTGYQILLPKVTTIANSDLPFGQNDGALFAGKGYNVRLLAGVLVKFGPAKLILAPEFISQSNYRMSIDPIDLRFARPLPPDRSQFSSPFNVVPYSIDWPYAMGDSASTKLFPGQSSLSVALGPMEVVAGTENEWIGPAVRNPIIMSDNAGGFPHATIRTGRPINSAIGQFEGRWIIGGLHESDFFDNDVTNDVRSISTFGFSWKRKPTSNAVFGFARSVYQNVDGYSSVAGHAFDFLKSTGHPDALPITDSTMTPGPDQVYELFVRWVIPGYGLETYLEWARTEFPRSLRDFLEQPNHTRGYTAGLQWLHGVGSSGADIRIESELTNVEQSSSYRFRPIGSFYTSRAVIQGYTNRGQMLGAGIGPGSSAESIGIDYLHPSYSFGAMFGRTRTNNDAFFTKSNPARCFHDVTIYPGLRGGIATKYFNVHADYNRLKRLNSYFQRIRGCGTDITAIGDRDSNHFSLTLTTVGW